MTLKNNNNNVISILKRFVWKDQRENNAMIIITLRFKKYTPDYSVLQIAKVTNRKDHHIMQCMDEITEHALEQHSKLSHALTLPLILLLIPTCILQSLQYSN